MSRKEKYLSVVLGEVLKAQMLKLRTELLTILKRIQSQLCVLAECTLAGWVHSPNLRVGLLQCACLLLIDGVCFLIQTFAPQELGVEGQMTEVCI